MGTTRKPKGLADALFSQVQLRVLNLLIGHPDKTYQITDVIRLVGSGRGAVQRELERLTEAGILTLTISGKRKSYQANRQSPVFNELRGLLLKTVGLVEPIRAALKSFAGKINVAFVYGSVAGRRDSAKSDIDLMILADQLSYSEIYSALQKAEKTLLRPINPNLLTVREWKKRVSDQSPFVSNIMQQPKIFILGSEDELERVGQSR